MLARPIPGLRCYPFNDFPLAPGAFGRVIKSDLSRVTPRLGTFSGGTFIAPGLELFN